MAKSNPAMDWFFNLFGLIALIVGGYWAISLYTGTVIPAIIEPYLGYIVAGLGLIWAFAEGFRSEAKIFGEDLDWFFNIFAIAISIVGGFIVLATYYAYAVPNLLVYIFVGGEAIWVLLEWLRK